MPSTNLLAARVSNALELVRNRMFRLDSMLKEQGDAHAPSHWSAPCPCLKLTYSKNAGHSNQLQVGRMSAIMTWKRDKHEAQANMLEPVECIQSVSLVRVVALSLTCDGCPLCSHVVVC